MTLSALPAARQAWSDAEARLSGSLRNVSGALELAALALTTAAAAIPIWLPPVAYIAVAWWCLGWRNRRWLAVSLALLPAAWILFAVCWAAGLTGFMLPWMLFGMVGDPGGLPVVAGLLAQLWLAFAVVSPALVAALAAGRAHAAVGLGCSGRQRAAAALAGFFTFWCGFLLIGAGAVGSTAGLPEVGAVALMTLSYVPHALSVRRSPAASTTVARP